MEDTLSISFSGEASEGFADRITQMKDWYVALTPKDPELAALGTIDAVIVGTGVNIVIDGGTWYDAVTYIPADEETGLALEGAKQHTIRVSNVHIY